MVATPFSYDGASASAEVPRRDPPSHPYPLHDVLIVGGGLVGSSLAIALAGTGLDVALLEAAPNDALPAVFDERNLSFAEATVNALARLGVMDRLRTPGGPIRRIQVTRRGDFGQALLQATEHGREQFGQVVVARDLGQALESRLAELPGLVRYRPARFLGLADEHGAPDGGHSVRVGFVQGERIVRARLLVGADGTRSAVRQALAIPVRERDYRQVLFAARLRAERVPDGTAYERLTEHGPTALLPRTDRHFGLIHTVPASEAVEVAELDERGFLARVQETIGWRVGRLLGCGERSAYPALQVVAEGSIAARAVLIGNAAQTLHPVGAQGFNLGLRDALTLAELLDEDARAASNAGRKPDPGDAALLARYAARRREDRDRTLAFSDGLIRVSAAPGTLMRPIRSLGLFAAARLPSVQSWLVGGAMGYRGEVPVLCRSPLR